MPSKAKTRKLKKAPRIGAPAPSGGPTGEIVLYSAPDGTVELTVRLERETVWLTQKQMSELFGTERSVITKHLGNIFKAAELKKDSVSAYFAHTAADGKTYRRSSSAS